MTKYLPAAVWTAKHERKKRRKKKGTANQKTPATYSGESFGYYTNTWKRNVPTSAPVPAGLSNRLKQQLLKRLAPKSLEPFKALGDVTETVNGPLIYQDNGAKLLAVAHLDYVKWAKPSIKGGLVKCPQLDDRLGAWVILDVLKELGVECDILLTDSEETGQSTAKFFETSKQYNWILEFDRADDDAVMYDYSCKDLRKKLEEVGYYVGMGSFTDICYLDTLGCRGINFAVGYKYQHTDDCYADLNVTWESLAKFMDFYGKHKDTRFEYTKPEPVIWRPSKSSGYNMGGWIHEDDDLAPRGSGLYRGDRYVCNNCGGDQLWYYQQSFCTQCDRRDLQLMFGL